MTTSGIGLSLIFIAVGAILVWAVDASLSGLDIQVVGTILMVVGAIGLVFTLLFLASFAPFARDGRGGDSV